MTPAEATQAVRQAIEEKRLVPSAFENIEAWLTEDRYSDYRDQVVALIADERWQELDDAFWTIIPFGTGGRRGQMYPVGSNMINDRTIGESAQGLADYVIEYNQGKESLSCAIAYDTRHRSRHFAELCAGIMAAAGIKVYFLDDYRATPQLSFAVRHKGCDCGIMVTASHNPPSDNAVKVYWSSGAQVLPPHDKARFHSIIVDQQRHLITLLVESLDHWSFCSQIERNNRDLFQMNVLPNIKFCPIRYRKNSNAFARTYFRVVEIP